MNTSTTLLAATEYAVAIHVALFVMALAAVILPLWFVSYMVERENKARQKKHAARIEADERFHTLLRELNRREAETRAQKIKAVTNEQPAAIIFPPDTAGRRKFLPLNPQQGCVS